MFRTLGERTTVRIAERDRRRRVYRSVADTFTIPASAAEDRTGSPAKPVTKKRALAFKVDVPLLLVIVSLLIFGLLMVYSASYDYSFLFYGDSTIMFKRQLVFLAIGLVAMITLIFVDYHFWRRVAVVVMGGTIFLLVCVFLANEVLNGASRTLYRGSVQPSELAKLVTIIYLSVWLFARRGQLSNIQFGLIPLAVILGILGGLIVSQPDLSAMVMIFCLGGLMFFLAGGDLRQIGLLLLVALVVGWLIVQISPTASQRVTDYLAGLKDPTKGSAHVLWSFEAFVKGGWLGVGIGKAETKLIGLPVPPTDSIYAVVGEETGVFGAIGLVFLYGLLLWRSLVIARRAPDELGSLLAAGLGIWIAMEAFINMAVMVNLLPFAGNALPFISSGGSNLVVSLAAIGIMLNISRLSTRKKEENGKLFDAVVDLRRWDRRRRVSSPRRPSGVAR
jgi:cell division protein FtsW